MRCGTLRRRPICAPLSAHERTRQKCSCTASDVHPHQNTETPYKRTLNFPPPPRPSQSRSCESRAPLHDAGARPAAAVAPQTFNPQGSTQRPDCTGRCARSRDKLQRGVREHESDMTTAIMMGEFLANGSLRKEFYDICFSMKGHI
jgi:hypothetical protein